LVIDVNNLPPEVKEKLENLKILKTTLDIWMSKAKEVASGLPEKSYNESLTTGNYTRETHIVGQDEILPILNDISE
jgi:hypothetical protein